jgi:Putative peptidoglycan binding domain
MNWKKFILVSCMVSPVLAVSPATAQMRGHRASMGRMPMQRTPMVSSASGFHRFNGRDFHRDHRFHRFNRFNEIIVVDNFGFPFFSPFFYPYPYFGYYPYGYYGYGYYGGPSYGYDTRSRVAELQRRLARAGYYHGAIDGIMGPATRRAIRAYEHDHGRAAYGAIDQRLLFEDRNNS